MVIVASARSSIGQSIGLRNRGLQVRVLSGVLVFTRVYVHSVAHSAHFGTVFGTVESGIDLTRWPRCDKGAGV